MKMLAVVAGIFLIILCLGGCTGITAIPVDNESIPESERLTSGVDEDDPDNTNIDSQITYIKFNGNSISIQGSGAKSSGIVLTVVSPGAYQLSGVLDNGQIRVNSGGQENVNLILAGVQIKCQDSAAIYVINSAKTIITLAENTINKVNDGSVYSFSDNSGEPDAAIFSKSDLTINGEGNLSVTASYAHGIVSKDNLKINGGNISVTAVKDGLRGRDEIMIKAGKLAIIAGNDGLQSNNDEDADKGNVEISGGELTITAANDGIQAVNSLLISGGSISIISGGGANQSTQQRNQGFASAFKQATSSNTTTSGKGLKCDGDITIDGGSLTLDCADDGLNSNQSLNIKSGTITIASGDDGIHADSSLTIDGGNTTITRSYEGIESQVVTINSGRIHLTSSDDGINVTGGEVSQEGFGKPGQTARVAGNSGTTGISAQNTNRLYIHDGYLYINAGGDGIDVNGSVEMSGGTVIVNGPTNSGNGPLDYYQTFTITGGQLLAVGSSGMAQATSNNSTQCTVMFNLAAAQTAGTLIHIQDAEGNTLLTFKPAKDFQSIVWSSPELQQSMTCIVYCGGSVNGTATDGWYDAGCNYSGGSQAGSLTLNSIVTSSVSQSRQGGMNGGQPGMRQR